MSYQSRSKRTFQALVTIFVALCVCATAHAKLPKGFALDHGYTFFNVQNNSDSVDGKRVHTGWQLVPLIRIYGDAPERSSIKLVLSKDGDVVAERRTQTTVYGKGNPNLQLVAGNTAAGWQQPHLLVRGGIQGMLPPVTSGGGTYEVEVIYIDGDTNKEYSAHTYTINVEKVDKLDSAAKELLVRPPEYFVTRHQELLSTILTPWGDYKGGAFAGVYQLLWNASPMETGVAPSNTTGNAAYLRCTVDGDPIKLGQSSDQRYLDATSTRSLDNDRLISLVHSDRNALEYRGGTAYREPLIFYQYQTTLPFQDTTDDYPPADGGQPMPYTTLENHDGEWECQFLDNGTLLRTFSWEVEDGTLIPHPEQEEGLTLNPGAILVETRIPENGTVLDGRTLPDAVEDGGFYGWEWETRRMRRLADDVPELGNPYPIASAPEFVPEPDAGASPQELARARRAAEASAAAAERRQEQEERAQRLEAEREQYASDEAARLAENERIRSEAMEKEMARTQAELEDTLGAVQQSMEEAQQRIAEEQAKANRSSIHGIMRVVLSLLLIASGLILAGGKIAALEGVVKAMTPFAGTIGIATFAAGAFDLILDLVILRPIVGDGLAQLGALAAGGALARDMINKLTAGKIGSVLDAIQAQGANVGYAAFALGVLHLVMGGSSFI
ncbi:MAG: hypothetical protein KJO85_02720 [Gammaproteobacteria bacterium]|nr:hypothetical protein [Gammaproteobacteria bacterium]